MTFGTLDCSDGDGILNAVAKLMLSIYTPAVNAIEKWGDLDQDPCGQTTRKEFLKSMGMFTHFIDGKMKLYFMLICKILSSMFIMSFISISHSNPFCSIFCFSL